MVDTPSEVLVEQRTLPLQASEALQQRLILRWQELEPRIQPLGVLQGDCAALAQVQGRASCACAWCTHSGNLASW